MSDKVNVQLEVFSELRGSPPEVPLAEGINYDELVSADLAEGQEPMFVTLPIAQFGQVSRNQRRYPEIEVRRMYEQIISSAVTGALGHLRIEERSHRFDIPVVKWVGASIVGQELWGKMYILNHRKDVREYMRVQKATNGKVGTSLYALAYENFNEDAGVFDISDIELEQIDVVHPDRVGVLFAATMPPHLTTETIQEAEAGELSVGDFVQWERDGNLVRGQVNTIWIEGEVEIPYNGDSPALPASADNPIARMDVFEPNYQGKGWLRSSWQVIQYVRDLTKIEALPVPESQEAIHTDVNHAIETEDLSRTDTDPVNNAVETGDSTTEEIIQTEKESEMTNNPQSDAATRIAAMEETHLETVRELNLQITNLQKNARTFKRICEMLGVSEGEDPILALQARLTVLEAAQKENADLLSTAIESEINKNVAVDWVRGTVIEMVTQMHPQSRAEVTACVQEALKNENVKLIMKNAVRKESGPNLETPSSTPVPEEAGEEWFLIPTGEDS